MRNQEVRVFRTKPQLRATRNYGEETEELPRSSKRHRVPASSVCPSRLHLPTCESICFLSNVQLFVTPWTVTRQVLLYMGFSRQEYCSGLPCPPRGDFSDPGINPGLLHCRWTLYHLSHQAIVPS